MTQKNVEILIGRLASDEALRAEFVGDPLATIRSLQARGLELSATEVDALRTLDPAALATLAARLDPRLQRAPLPRSAEDGGKSAPP